MNNLERIALLDAFYRFVYEAEKQHLALEEIHRIEEQLIERGLLKRG